MGRLSMGESLTGPKVPGREEVVNDGPKAALSPGPETGFGGGSSGRATRGTRVRCATSTGGMPIAPASAAILGQDGLESLTKRRPFSLYQKLPRTL